VGSAGIEDAAHCNTLQDTATLCNTLQHTATLYSTGIEAEACGGEGMGQARGASGEGRGQNV